MTSAIYTEVDLMGFDMNVADPQTIPGITKTLTAAVSTGAPILLTGIVNDDTPISPMFAVVIGTLITLPIGASLGLDPDNDTLEITT